MTEKRAERNKGGPDRMAGHKQFKHIQRRVGGLRLGPDAEWKKITTVLAV